MARLTLARKIAAITLIVWKKEVRFDAHPMTCLLNCCPTRRSSGLAVRMLL
jgi:hypothetical protein